MLVRFGYVLLLLVCLRLVRFDNVLLRLVSICYVWLELVTFG